MLINASAVGVSVDRAKEVIRRTIERRSIVFWMKRKKVLSIEEDGEGLLYFPYFIMDCLFFPDSGMQKKIPARQIVAMEGVSGDAGLVIGVPEVKETEADEKNIVRPRYTDLSAIEEMTKYLKEYFVRKKRINPVITEEHHTLIYKPVYSFKVCYEDNGRKIDCVKMVDAETGYIIYRYDVGKNHKILMEQKGQWR